MLSSRIALAPASTASTTCSRRAHSTCTARTGHRSFDRATASAIPMPVMWLSFSRLHSDARDLVFLRQDPLREVAAVVPATTGADRRLLEGAEPRRGLAGVPHLGR